MGRSVCGDLVGGAGHVVPGQDCVCHSGCVAAASPHRHVCPVRHDFVIVGRWGALTQVGGVGFAAASHRHIEQGARRVLGQDRVRGPHRDALGGMHGMNIRLPTDL
jgi:hypothetical protein